MKLITKYKIIRPLAFAVISAVALCSGCGGCGQSSDGPVSDSLEDETVEIRETAEAVDEEIPLVDIVDMPASDDAGVPDEEGDEIEIPDPEDPCDVDPQPYDRAVLTDFDPHSIEHDPVMFPLAVQAGSMTTESVILWGYASNSSDKTLMVWRETGDETRVALVMEATISPVEGYMKYYFEGLAPGTWYHYAFFDPPEDEPLWRSLIGKFRTAIHEDCMAPITIGGTHGSNFNLAPYRALEITARYDLDVFFQLGDFSYNDGSSTIEDFRAKWHQTLADPGYVALLPRTGQYIVWDDHEIEDNAQLYIDIVINPGLIETGKNAFFETTPVPRHENNSYWRSYKWGKTAEMFILDCRHERQPETMLLPDAIYIGREQMDWLKDTLLITDAHFKIIANSVPIANYIDPPWLMASDRWQGYAAQRSELLDFIADNSITNVWFLSGDFHTGSVATVDREGPHRFMWEINMGPGGQDNNPLWASYSLGIMQDLIAPPNQFLFFYGEPVATIMTLDPVSDTVSIIFIDAVTEDVLFNQTFSYTDVP